MRSYCLRLHAGYQCQHVGACCNADWLIPAELHVITAVERHGIRAAHKSDDLFVPSGDGDLQVAVNRHGTCAFFDAEDGRLCAIHRKAGIEALPSACRHFPREILIDGRGTLISLSHFCPTAAELLFTPGGLDVVEAFPPLRLEAPVEGLDATEVPAPPVRPGLLADLEGYDAWERACLATLARPGVTSDQALGLIAAATEDVREWRPGRETLTARVGDAFRHRVASPAPNGDSFRDLSGRHFPPEAGPVPSFDDVWRRLAEPWIGPIDYAIKNYLASRLFGNWIAYQGRGLRTIVEWLRTTRAVLTNEIARRCAISGTPLTRAHFLVAAGAADYLLLHTIDSETVARELGRIEGPEPR
jgi:hypothetical protein